MGFLDPHRLLRSVLAVVLPLVGVPVGGLIGTSVLHLVRGTRDTISGALP